MEENLMWVDLSFTAIAGLQTQEHPVLVKMITLPLAYANQNQTVHLGGGQDDSSKLNGSWHFLGERETAQTVSKGQH
ncbi:MAG: hypothetical protein EA342_15595 [Leptolyngbya sp. LCM1.Bin17]|nr:MAG: hypothetical protein EA342_15595 [Leptolyngbya sp. LCM1.Bin17]